MVGGAFLLRVLSWPQAVALAVAAILFNCFVLPRAGGRAIFRPDDIARGVPAGILFYPLAVLLLILCSRPDIAAAAWAILAVGDGIATLAGTAIGGARLPWNGEKTWAGTIAFFLAGTSAGVLLCWWTQPALTSPAPTVFVVGAPVLAAAVAALVESIPVRLDDNLSVPCAAAATLWVLSLVDRAMVDVMLPGVVARLLPAVLVNAVFAAAAFAERLVSWSGVIVGGLIGIAIYLGAGWQGWTMLLATFVSAAATSKVGWQRKRALGIAEDQEGRRGAANALANCLVACVAALLAIGSPHQAAAWRAVVTALTAGGSDTVASEIGKARGRRTFLVIGFRPVPPGTPGAISLEGTLAGVVSATLLATLGAAVGLLPASAIWIVVVGATAGAFVESTLAATLEPRRILDNHLLNFINTAVAVAVALLIGPV
jgi:uncharacterized protein (TIGR00297 family)